MGKRNLKQVARAGQHFVVAEIHRRGGYASFSQDTPRIEILATNTEQTRNATIRVKTMTTHAWQVSMKWGRKRKQPTEEDTHFWIFVELKQPPAQPVFYVVPEWWIENDIYSAHEEYLAEHGGERPKTKESTHHAIPQWRIAQWRDRWDLLQIFPEDEPG